MSQFWVSTKQDKDSDAKRTLLTVDFKDCPQATLEHLATQHLVVRLQGSWRKGQIPNEATVRVSDYAPGSRMNGAVNIEAAIAVMSKEDKQKLLAKLIKESEEREAAGE